MLTKLNHKYFSLFLFILPALIVYLVFRIIPTIGGIVYSFTSWDGLNAAVNFIGVKNYLDLLSDRDFIYSFGITFKYVFFAIILHNFVALFLALLIENAGRTKGIFRTIFFYPNMFSLLVGGYMWTFVFSKAFVDVGRNTFLTFFDQSWFGDPQLAFITIITVSTWIGMGYNMIIYIAALNGIPDELIECAHIDGAGPITTFFKIKLPLIMHALTICIFLTIRAAFKAFDVVVALTNGGPAGTTEVVALNVYIEAFIKSNYGYASAKAIILFLVIFVVAIIQLSVMKRLEVDL